MKAVFSLLLALFVTGALTLVVSAQQDPPPAPAAPPAREATPSPSPHPAAMARPFVFLGGWQQDMHQQSKATQLAREFVAAAKEEDKTAIREKLTETLNQVFDEHMKQQQKELDELEKQIANLRLIMKKRTAAKETIVDRRIDQMIQDAEGLGWSAPGAPSVPSYSPDYTPASQFRSPAAPKANAPKKKSEDSREKKGKRNEEEE